MHLYALKWSVLSYLNFKFAFKLVKRISPSFYKICFFLILKNKKWEICNVPYNACKFTHASQIEGIFEFCLNNVFQHIINQEFF